MAKLSSFDSKTLADKGVEFELSDIRTGKGSGAFITVHGTDSDALRAYRARLEAEFIELSASGKKDDVEPIVRSARFLSEMTVGWRELEDDDGQIAFSTEKAAEVYLQHPALREQVDIFIARRENFLLG